MWHHFFRHTVFHPFRGFGEPDPVTAALLCEAAGAHGITAHLREDRRHMQDRDIWALREKIRTRNQEREGR